MINPIFETGQGLKSAWNAARNSFEPVPEQVKSTFKETAGDIKEVLQEELKNLAYGISALPKFAEQEFLPIFTNAVTWVAVGALAIANATAPNFIPPESLQATQIGLGIGNGLLATAAAHISIRLGDRYNNIKRTEAAKYAKPIVVTK